MSSMLFFVLLLFLKHTYSDVRASSVLLFFFPYVRRHLDILGVDTRRRRYRPTPKNNNNAEKKFFICVPKSRPHAFFLLLFNVMSVAANRIRVVVNSSFWCSGWLLKSGF